MSKFLNIFFILLLSACNYSHDKIEDSVLKPQKVTPPAKLTYKDVSAAVIEPACLSCHSDAAGNKGGLNLESYAKVFASKDSIKTLVATKAMPPASRTPLNDQQIKMIIDWVEAGALENGADSPPGTTPPTPTPTPTPPPTNPPVDPVKYSYAMVNEKVIKTNCFKCHTAIAGNSGDVNLENYRNVFEKRNEIKFQIETGAMPAKGGKPLTPEQKNMILNWIEQGAPEETSDLKSVT